MAIGSYSACIAQGTMERCFLKIWGIPDYHTHIRLKPILHYMKKNRICGSFMELGCGQGSVAFELNKRGFVRSYVGIDLNEKAISRANSIKEQLGSDNLSFVEQDVFDYLKNAQGEFDWLILYDFIEHIPDPQEFLHKLLEMVHIRKGIIVSVPTPRYPKVFGRSFHEKIGHLVDGYKKIDIDRMFSELRYKSIYHEYNTGGGSSIGASIFYRLVRPYDADPMWRGIVFLATSPFRLIDINSEKLSCSLYSVYTKIDHS